MSLEKIDRSWRNHRAVRSEFGTFINIDEVTVEVVDGFAHTGATSRYRRIWLRVAPDWEQTVRAPGLAETPRIFPIAAEPADSWRPDVRLWRSRYIQFGCLVRQPAPGQPWCPSGERYLHCGKGRAEEGFVARTICGLGSAFHETAAGAVIREVRSRGRERARIGKADLSGTTLAMVVSGRK